MNIKQAKQEIANTLKAYLTKDELGNYLIPAIRQRPVLLMGPPGIGKTQIMEQIAAEEGVGLVAYTITHHTRHHSLPHLPNFHKRHKTRSGHRPKPPKIRHHLPHVAKAFDDKVLYEDLDFTLPPAAIIGVIGPNGVGKTTLFRLIMGLETPDSGTFETGETVRLAYVDQQHKDIDPEKSVYEVISGGSELMRLGGRDVNARAYLSRFNFSGADQEKKCGVLSGGERNRLQLALALKQEGNVLLLDEPTNDIDINTLRALEEGLEAFAGCAVIISHDRWFLDRICTHILSFEGDGKVFFFEGSYTDYEANKAKRLGIEEPKRQRYRKLDE